MRMDEMIMISTDDHLIEPPGLFDGRMPAKFRDQTPRYQEDEQGVGFWMIGDAKVRNPANGSIAGRPPWEYGFEPNSIGDLRKGCYDVHARIDDMNLNGQIAAMCFPTITGFAGSTLRNGKDKELMLAINQAWNDWNLEEWCGAYPGRFIPFALIPTWDPALCAAEIKRVHRKGCNAISMVPVPSRAGLPSLHDSAWNPLWRVCDDLGVAICLHIGDTTGIAPSEDSPYEVWATCLNASLMNVSADLAWSPILRTYKNLRFVLSEGQAGWIPHFFDRMDFVYKHHHWWTNQQFGKELPSEVFRRHCYSCIMDDPTAIQMRNRIGVETMTWECDYPHSDSPWPRGPEVMWRDFEKYSVPKEDIDKITHLNAMEAFHFDPFQHTPREQATVSVLRAQAKAKGIDPGFVFDHDNPPFHEPPGGFGREIVTMQYYMKYASSVSARMTMPTKQSEQ